MKKEKKMIMKVNLFKGEYLNGNRWNGKGKEHYDDKLIIEGEYLNGERWNGKGNEYYED